MAVAECEETPLATVLGTAIAHEIGHVLLRSSTHSLAGVMSPKLDHRLLHMALSGALMFTASQSAQLRAAASRFIGIN
jgi:hypothetical protein